MSTDTNKAKVRAYFGHADSGNLKAWRAAMAPGAVIQVNGDPDMTMDQFETTVAPFFAAFSNARHIIDQQFAEGDWVITRLYWTALHSGAFNGIPASNRPVRMLSVSCDRLQNGRIVEHRATIDVMALMQQIGAIPVAA
jgi:predicted ester cyclase